MPVERQYTKEIKLDLAQNPEGTPSVVVNDLLTEPLHFIK